MDSKKYRRYFVILGEEDEGYGIQSSKSPKGYTKIEVKNGKGVLTHFIQNIKFFNDAEYVYRSYLISTRNNSFKYVDNGILKVDENGKAELKWEFDSESVDKKHTSITEFNIVVIIAQYTKDSHRKSLIVPLSGFIDKKKVPWRDTFKKLLLEKRSDETFKNRQIRDSIKIKEEDSYISSQEPRNRFSDNYMDKKQVAESIIKPNRDTRVSKPSDLEGLDNMFNNDDELKLYKDINEEKEDNFYEEEVEQYEFLREVPKDAEKEFVEYDKKNLDFIDEKFSENEENEINSHKEFNLEGLNRRNEKEYSPYQQHFKTICSYVESMLGYYPEIIPFDRNIQNTRWWRIDADNEYTDTNILPFYNNGYENAYESESSCPALINKYEHYIFGIKYDKGDTLYYMYGIPGRFIESEQPYEGMTGFVYWHPVETSSSDINDYGYWILHIDAQTGRIAIPKNPSVPPRI